MADPLDLNGKPAIEQVADLTAERDRLREELARVTVERDAYLESLYYLLRPKPEDLPTAEEIEDMKKNGLGFEEVIRQLELEFPAFRKA